MCSKVVYAFKRRLDSSNLVKLGIHSNDLVKLRFVHWTLNMLSKHDSNLVKLGIHLVHERVKPCIEVKASNR